MVGKPGNNICPKCNKKPRHYKQSYCTTCKRKHYNTYHKRTGYKYCQSHRLKMRLFIREAKNKPCKDCKKVYHYSAMDFDHVKGKKKYTIADHKFHYKSKATIKKELDKCEVVCSNCHRIRTFKRKYGLKKYNETKPK